MVLRNVLSFYVLHKKSFNSSGCMAVVSGDTGGGKMSAAGFDLEVPAAFASQLWWHSADGSVPMPSCVAAAR